jgi:predicted CXXCH cytochrome family protein
MLLYTRNEATVAGGYQPFVECASCHDPHTENATFLRISNAGSAVCLACHTK